MNFFPKSTAAATSAEEAKEAIVAHHPDEDDHRHHQQHTTNTFMMMMNSHPSNWTRDNDNDNSDNNNYLDRESLLHRPVSAGSEEDVFFDAEQAGQQQQQQQQQPYQLQNPAAAGGQGNDEGHSASHSASNNSFNSNTSTASPGSLLWNWLQSSSSSTTTTMTTIRTTNTSAAAAAASRPDPPATTRTNAAHYSSSSTSTSTGLDTNAATAAESGDANSVATSLLYNTVVTSSTTTMTTDNDTVSLLTSPPEEYQHARGGGGTSPTRIITNNTTTVRRNQTQQQQQAPQQQQQQQRSVFASSSSSSSQPTQPSPPSGAVDSDVLATYYDDDNRRGGRGRRGGNGSPYCPPYLYLTRRQQIIWAILFMALAVLLLVVLMSQWHGWPSTWARHPHRHSHRHPLAPPTTSNLDLFLQRCQSNQWTNAKVQPLVSLLSEDDNDDNNNSKKNDDENNASATSIGLVVRTVELETCTAWNQVCLLIQTDCQGTWKPLARSYHGQDWEPYIVNFESSVVGIDCRAVDGIMSKNHSTSSTSNNNKGDTTVVEVTEYGKKDNDETTLGVAEDALLQTVEDEQLLARQQDDNETHANNESLSSSSSSSSVPLPPPPMPRQQRQVCNITLLIEVSKGDCSCSAQTKSQRRLEGEEDDKKNHEGCPCKHEGGQHDGSTHHHHEHRHHHHQNHNHADHQNHPGTPSGENQTRHRCPHLDHPKEDTNEQREGQRSRTRRIAEKKKDKTSSSSCSGPDDGEDTQPQRKNEFLALVTRTWPNHDIDDDNNADADNDDSQQQQQQQRRWNLHNEFARFLEQATFGTTHRDVYSLLHEYSERHERAKKNLEQWESDEPWSDNDNATFPLLTATNGSASTAASTAASTTSSSTTTAVTIMAQWMQHQMQNVKPTLHREFFRRHATARSNLLSTPTGRVTHPCLVHAAYRNFAFVESHAGEILEIVALPDKTTDSRAAKDDNDNSTMTTPTKPARKQWLLLVDHVALTTVEGPIQFVPWQGDDDTVEQHVLYGDTEPDQMISWEFEEGRYEFCPQTPEPFVGGKVWLKHPKNDECTRPVQFGSFPGNPLVHFSNDIHPLLQVVLPEDSVRAMDREYYSTMQPPMQRLLTITTLTDTICHSLNSLEKSNSGDGEHRRGGGAIPVVFGRFRSEYWIHDSRFILHENSLSRPWADGGGSLVPSMADDMERSGVAISSSNYFETKCANVPRSWLNEQSCFISYHPQACASTSKQSWEDWYPLVDANNSSFPPTKSTPKGTVVCGSPGEVANDLSQDGEAHRGAFDIYTTEWHNSTRDRESRQTIWTTLAVVAYDQLRQRMAWALSQILLIHNPSNPMVTTEAFANYHDIFVRNAFGNYRDVLKEVSYNVLMANMLTYRGSRSTGYNWRQKYSSGIVEHADENYAREIMQLFSIGLYELNNDGTRTLDHKGRFIRTYSNDDIMEYARVWTGFREASARGNIDNPLNNHIDPMQIRVPWRDVFPKMGLGQKYIGDGYPLCADRPEHHFLKKGAKYILLGYNPLPELQEDSPIWVDDPHALRFVAEPSGQLNYVLCDGTGQINSPCNYPPVVTLRENLKCEGIECELDTLRVVEVTGGVFYEYVPLPCVHQAFYENPQKIKKSNQDGSTLAWMCADPRVPAASTACCFGSPNANISETYWGERVTAFTAERRCAMQAEASEESASYMCSSTGALSVENCVGSSCAGNSFYWMSTEAPCQLKAKIASNGKIAVVHTVPDEDDSVEREYGQEEEDNKTFFRVPYLSGEGNITDLFENCSANPECSITVDDFCMCNVIVSNEQAYYSAPTREEVISSLTIGSYDPADGLGGSLIVTTEGTVKVHSRDGRLYSGDTVFEVVDNYGLVHFRKNVFSFVRIAGTNIRFRNPVQFMSLSEPTLRDAEYETDATLNHYLYHKNTAPFLAVRLAERFGASNPTPGYVRRIAEAFRSGRYIYADSVTSISFGKGIYGDLEATLAAILLDPEARSVVLDVDPSHGWLKEPILKIIGLMRNLDFRPTPEYPFLRFSKDMQITIGQMVYQAPSVFSYFHPEFKPIGLVSEAGLVAPEAERHSSPQVIGTMNGLLAMIKYGLDRCFGGLGHSRNWRGIEKCNWRIPGNYANSSSYPVFVPTNAGAALDVVDELSILMTSGRLSAESRAMIVDEVKSELDPLNAILKAEQLIASTSEFHSSGTITKSGSTRNKEKDVTPSEKPYKAFVLVLLNGGFDSYNLVVPRTCTGTNDEGTTVLQQYIAERGDIRLRDDERNLMITAQGQPCETFAIHDKMPIIQELYNQGDLSFFMNAGVINEPPTKETFEAVTVSQLFAHDAMQEELQRVDPFNEIVQTGILRRISKVLNSEPYGFQAQTLSINYFNRAVYGDDAQSPRPIVMSEYGPQKFNDKPTTEAFDPRPTMESLNGMNEVTSSFFGELWSGSFMRALDENDFLECLINKVSLKYSCGSKALNMVAKLMETRSGRGNDRDLFYIDIGGWDHHSNLKHQLNINFAELNEALTCFKDNVKDKGLWDNVTLLVVSEFGRTITPNTNLGSDHGWAGHYFAMGGALKGGKMHGQYPSDLTSKGPLNVGRGRMIPTLSWESIFAPIAQWLGLSKDEFDYVFPNANRTNTPLLERTDVFEEGL